VGIPVGTAAGWGSRIFGLGVENMPGTALAIREADRHQNTYHDYLYRSTYWAWEFIAWYVNPIYANYARRDEAAQVCWDALQRNLKWQAEARIVPDDPYKDEDDNQERMTVKEAARQLADMLDRLSYFEFDVSFTANDQVVVMYANHVRGDDASYITRTARNWEVDAIDGWEIDTSEGA
jgi:hypothetical protein